ncbi:MAG: hypothetical protein IPN53_25685 [Comamonadaceae bacterium]|nr:hypothetical protein [Comamonadaceae bacterium]
MITRLSLAEMTAALEYMGHIGFGRDAGIGLGRFELLGDAVLSGLRGEIAAPFQPASALFSDTVPMHHKVWVFARYAAATR